MFSLSLAKVWFGMSEGSPVHLFELKNFSSVRSGFSPLFFLTNVLAVFA